MIADHVSVVPLAAEHLESTFLWMTSQALRDAMLIEQQITRESHLAWFQARHSDCTQAIRAIVAGGLHVGNCGYRHLDSRHRTGELWIYLGPEHQGKGLAGRALRSAVEVGFDELGLRKIYLTVRPSNTRAFSIYVRAGFEVEGVLRAEQIYHGRPVDLLRMALHASAPAER